MHGMSMGQFSMVDLLLSRGADVDLQNVIGWSTLMLQLTAEGIKIWSG